MNGKVCHRKCALSCCILIFFLTPFFILLADVLGFINLYLFHTLSPAYTSASSELRFIPVETQRIWESSEYSIVLGISSIDNAQQRRRRDLQRTTCWSYNGVATQANNFEGVMLVLFLLSPDPLEGYSAELKVEAKDWRDLVSLNIESGGELSNATVPSTSPTPTEVTTRAARKTLQWFKLALQLFSSAKYIAKGDDDIFLRVPLYLVDLHGLPLHGLYWGSSSKWTHDAPTFTYINGHMMTLSRDVVQHLVLCASLKKLLHQLSNATHKRNFAFLQVESEDVMMGWALRKSHYSNITLVEEPSCRYRSAGRNAKALRVSPTHVLLHRISESEYVMLMQWFNGKELIAHVKPKRVGENVMVFDCAS